MLGTWQVYRLEWKNDLIANYNSNFEMPPVSIADLFDSELEFKYRRVFISPRYCLF